MKADELKIDDHFLIDSDGPEVYELTVVGISDSGDYLKLRDEKDKKDGKDQVGWFKRSSLNVLEILKP